MEIKKQILLLVILSLGFVVRFGWLGQHPISLNRDEVAIGYNAYSLLKTGQDEWGVSWPLSFKSFGDYKMPGYIYATMLPVVLWGLTEFSVRFWSALSGSLAIVLVYFLSKWLFSQLKFKRIETWSLLAALVLVFNPWHVYFSRVGFEANLNLSLFLLGLTAFFYGLRKRWLLFVSALAFSAMLYTYSSSFVFLPFLGLLLFAFFGKQLFQKKDFWLFLAGLILLALGGHATWSVWQVSQAKTNITIFSDPGILDNFNHLRSQVFAQSPIWAKVWLNKPFFYLRIFLRNYLASFSPRFLFISAGDHPWHQIPGMGHFYWLDGLLLLLGLLTVFKKRDKISLFLLGWLLVAPLPSAITVDAPHATRMLQLAPVLVIFIALGWRRTWKIKKRSWSNLLLVGLVAVYTVQIIRFAYLYLTVYPKQVSQSMMPGIDKAINWVEERERDRLVIFTNPLDFAYIYVAFYRPIEPDKIQAEAEWKPPDLANLTAVEKVGRYRFWEGTPDVDQKAYYVLPPNIESPGGFERQETIQVYGEPRWYIYAN